jgi:DNA-binding winged helix-turn-helix (wHTH) protein
LDLLSLLIERQGQLISKDAIMDAISRARDFMPPAIRTLFETTYLAGLRKAGVPEE